MAERSELESYEKKLKRRKQRKLRREVNVVYCRRPYTIKDFLPTVEGKDGDLYRVSKDGLAKLVKFMDPDDGDLYRRIVPFVWNRKRGKFLSGDLDDQVHLMGKTWSKSIRSLNRLQRMFCAKAGIDVDW